MTHLRVSVLVSILSLSTFAFAQQAPGTNPDTEIRVTGINFHAAPSRDSTVVLSTALAMFFRNSDVCCGRNSALVDLVGTADPASLASVSHKLQGRHVLGDGRPVVVTSQYFSANPHDGSAPAADRIITAMRNDQPLLIQWHSKLYVRYGVVLNTYVASGGDQTISQTIDAIHKLLLFDPQSGREAVFDRTTDDWNTVEGLLWVSVAPSSS